VRPSLALLVALLLVATAAHAGEGGGPRFGLGIQLVPAGSPHGTVGIPIAGTTNEHLPVGLTFRWVRWRWAALHAGIGIPVAPLGLALWAGFEPFWTVVRDSREIVALELYAAPALQLGFAGPDEGARRSDAFIGLAYIYQGPLAFALRTPVGVRLRWWHARFDTYAEALPVITFTPSVTPIFGVAVGARVNF
jgi:hypothetical protein